MADRFPNKVIKIGQLDKDTAAKVRARENGLFTNTFIVDKEEDILHMYTREGKYHCSDVEFTYALSEYEWYMNNAGYILSDDVLDDSEESLEMGRLILTYVELTK